MRYAHMDGDVVAEIITVPEGFTLADVLHPDFAARCVPTPPGVGQGWVLSGGAFSPPPTVEPPTPDLVALAANKRWQVETGGVLVGGVPVATDDRSKVMIMGARIKADADPDYVVGWKGADGSFIELTAPAIIAISNAVLAHVDASFAAEAALSQAIADGSVTTVEQIEEGVWPPNG